MLLWCSPLTVCDVASIHVEYSYIQFLDLLSAEKWLKTSKDTVQDIDYWTYRARKYGLYVVW